MTLTEQFVVAMAKAIETAAIPPKRGSEPDYSWQDEQDRQQVFYDLWYEMQRLIKMDPELSTKLLEKDQEIQALKSRVVNLELLVTSVQASYEGLVAKNTKFMNACVCVKLAQEPNNPEAAFK